jgi:endonuclease-3
MARESQTKRKQRVAEIIQRLGRQYPDARTELNHSNPLELLVATILSAQSTDKGVNEVTADLFKKYKTAADYAGADEQQFQQEIRRTGFFRNKTRSVLGACRRIVDEYGGEVPETMDELLTLPGVARKTANVVLGNAFGVNAGIPVDTHVTRLANRLRLTGHVSNAGDKIEKDLLKLVPRQQWCHFSHLLIFHGRRVCAARRPNCEGCVINDLCPSAFKAS